MTPNLLLQGLRVLVTRPRQQAPKWQDCLQNEGASTLVARLLEVVPFDSDNSDDKSPVNAIKKCVLELDSYQHIIFVSQNAVQYGWHWIDQYWPQLPIKTRYYAVGSATDKALSVYDVPVVGRENGDGNNNSSTMNTEALVALPELQQLDNAKVLICRGAGGRPLLADVLQQRGAQVDYCELYQRRFPDGADKILRDNRWGQTGDVVAVHSGESLQNWLQLVARNNQPEWLDLPLLVPGERVASIALDAGCKEIIMAHNASDSMMLSKLISWHRQ